MHIDDHDVSVGLGTLFVLLFAAIGIALCIFGQATAMPGIFILIGILLPLIVFIICAFWPTEPVTGNKFKVDSNPYIVARWFYFSFMLVCFLGLAGPLICLFTITLIPQRVDSRAQHEADEKYKKFLFNKKKNDGEKGSDDNKSGSQKLSIGKSRDQSQKDEKQNQFKFPQSEDEVNQEKLSGFVRKKKTKRPSPMGEGDNQDHGYNQGYNQAQGGYGQVHQQDGW